MQYFNKKTGHLKTTALVKGNAPGMNRRQFLKHQLGAAALLAGGSLGLLAPEDILAAPAPDLAMAKGAPAAATRAAVEMLGGMQEFVRPGQRVVVKPNMSFANPPEWATTTHPEVVREIVAMCLEADAADVRVLDNPLRSGEICLERSGIAAACQGLGKGDIAHAIEAPSFYRDASIPKAKAMRENTFMKDVLAADVIIAAPVAKSHGSTGVSLSMKGMMGLIWNRGVMHSRYDLSESIVDLNTRLGANLAVVDATRVLTTNGPYGPGKVITPGAVIASRDFVAADAYTVATFEWWGRKMNPNQVKHIRLAHERGLGRMDIENLNVKELVL